MTVLISSTNSRPRRSGAYSISKLPINMFASVMGLTGLSLAWREAAKVIAIPALPGEAFGWLGLVAFILIALGYGLKLSRHRIVVASEYSDPVTGNFFGAIAIGLLLLSSFLFRYAPGIAGGLWIAGTLLAFLLAYLVVQTFLTTPQAAETTLPPLILPGVATLDIPVTGAALPYAWAPEVNLLGLSVGAVMALILIVMIFQRLRHFEPLPAASRPVLMMLVAPFAVGFIAYSSLNGIDLLAGILVHFGWFLFLVLAPVVFRRENRFGIAWWAVTFPLAALVIASFRYAEAQQNAVFVALSGLLFLFTTIAIMTIFIRTLITVLTGAMFRLEHAG